MWATIKKVLKDCTTENNGTSYCPVRCAGLALTIPAIGAFVVAGARLAIATGQGFPFHDFAMSFTVMMGGVSALGLGVAAKAFTDNIGCGGMQQ